MSICISGHTGFVGVNLKKYLNEKGYEITLINLRNSNTITFPSKAKAIVHLAGKAHDLKKVNQPEEYDEVNFGLTKRIFDAFLVSDAEVFITLSSVKAIGDTIEGVLTEDTPANPQTPYGQSKLLAEQYILSKSIPPGKHVYILRPCMIHGPGNKGNLNLLYALVSKKIPWPLAAFNNKRSFLSIDNLCFVIQELIDRRDIPSGIYQVADDTPLSTNVLVKLIAQVLNFSPRLWAIPKKIIVGISKVGDILGLPLNTERLQKLTESYIVNNEKIKSALKKELPLSSVEGLIKTIRSFENRHH
ncbi:MAG: NAD-dependent epimerase/dehydratase family protein [Pedobacter sp.]|nr:MAG: NAD-dependent epimerase/dehydratase family protein [Pedobacter sp.]